MQCAINCGQPYQYTRKRIDRHTHKPNTHSLEKDTLLIGLAEAWIIINFEMNGIIQCFIMGKHEFNFVPHRITNENASFIFEIREKPTEIIFALVSQLAYLSTL